MDVKAILRKIDETETPEVNKVAVAYAGGLDSLLSIELLRRKCKAKTILPITIDVGQGSPKESKTSLFSPEIRSIKATGFDQRRCTDGAFTRGLAFEILARRKTK